MPVMKRHERVTTFPDDSQILDPVEVYLQYSAQLLEDKHQLYITGPVTSGGAKRMYDFETVPEESKLQLMIQVIQENSTFANAVLKNLLGLHRIPDHFQITSPYHLGDRKIIDAESGEVRPWNESEYLPFWSMVMLGLKPEIADTYYASLTESMKTAHQEMDNRTQERSKRISNYHNLESKIRNIVGSLSNSEFRPVHHLLKFPDSEYSLGSTFEQRLAISIGVPVSEVVFNLDFPYPPSLFKDKVFQYLMKEDLLITDNTTQSFFPLKIALSSIYPKYKV